MTDRYRNIPWSDVPVPRTQIQDSARFSTHGSASIFCIRVSPDGLYLATGSDGGLLEIYTVHATVWELIQVYETGAPIRALTWHPYELATIFVGSANGRVHKISVTSHNPEDVCIGTVPGYIHLLEISPDGRRLAIAYGRLISIVQDPFPRRDELGTIMNLDIQLEAHIQYFTDHHIPRALFFLSDSIVVVTFFGQRGIIAYSTLNYRISWSIPLRSHSFVGSSALSPSRDTLAVMNLRDGIDFYSISRRQFLSTTRYETTSSIQPPLNLVVGIVFIDEHHVAVGHTDGYVAVARLHVSSLTGIFRFDRHRRAAPQVTVPIQTIGFGVIQGQPHIVVVVPPSEPGQCSDIHVGLVSLLDGTSTGQSLFVMYLRRIFALIPLDSDLIMVHWPTTLAVTLVAFLVFGLYASQRARSSVTISLPLSLPSNGCVCTITGTITTFLAKETGSI